MSDDRPGGHQPQGDPVRHLHLPGLLHRPLPGHGDRQVCRRRAATPGRRPSYSSVSNAYSVGLAKYFREPFTRPAAARSSASKNTRRATRTSRPSSPPSGPPGPRRLLRLRLLHGGGAGLPKAKQLGLDLPIFGGDGWEAEELIRSAAPRWRRQVLFHPFLARARRPAVQRLGGRVQEALGPHARCHGRPGLRLRRRAGRRPQAGRHDRAGGAAGCLAATKDYPGVTGSTTLDAHRDATKAAAILTSRTASSTSWSRPCPP